MKSWQEWITTITDWFRQHPSASRWTAIAVIVVALLAFLGNQSFFGTQKTVSLFDSRQLTTDEIGLMQVAFGKSGLNEYEIRETRIEVPHAMRGDYLKSLAEHGAIPPDLTSHLESRSSFDFFQTRAQQRTQQIARKKHTIRDMVMQLRFVDRAIVDYDETRGATPFEDMQRTAVVNVTPADNRVLVLSEVKAIRDTVRGAVAGLKSEDITIIDTFASKSHTGVVASESEQQLPHTITKMQAERKYENKIRSALTAYPGIRVNVEVGIDPVVRRIRDERNLDSEPVVVEHTIKRETSARIPAASPSLIQSVFDIGANRQGRVGANDNPVERSSEVTQSVANGTSQTTETIGPLVTHVNVSIGIPERCVQYFVDQNTYGQQPDEQEIQRQRNLVLEQLQQDIRQKVGPLVPGNHDFAKSQQIVVTLDREIPFKAKTDPPRNTMTGIAGGWPWIGLIGTIGAGFLVLYFFRPIGKSMRGMSPEPAAEPVTTLAGPSLVAGDSREKPHSGQIQTQSAQRTNSLPYTATHSADNPSLDSETQQRIRIQLDQWCRENPKAAAATIRQWLERKAG